MYSSIGSESNPCRSSIAPSLWKQAKSLAERAYNPAEGQTLNAIPFFEQRRRYLEKNLAATVNHVFEDSVVSFTNCYQMNNKGEIVSYPDGIKLSIDADERGGLYEYGITSAVWGALENKDQVMLLYSPPGPVVFDDNPDNKFRYVKPYTSGQLYLMYSDGKKVNNIAISTSAEDESLIAYLMPTIYTEASQNKSEIEKISYYISNPFLTGLPIHTFLQNMNMLKDKVIFKNKDGVEFSISQTVSMIRQSLDGKLTQSHIIDDILMGIDIERITVDDIHQIYGALAQRYMRGNRLTTLTLGGSCGGTEIKFDPLSNELENLSTTFRIIIQGKNVPGFLREKKDRYDNYKCPKCGSSLQGELVDRQETWKTECPHCHYKLGCAKT